MTTQKPYIEPLAEWLQSPEGVATHKLGRSAFLALRSQIQQAIDAGYPLKTIWLHMRHTGKLSLRYETFLRRVRKHLPPLSPPAQTPIQKTPPTVGFTFNPTPRKEDLY
jgi:hypothetical protein